MTMPPEVCVAEPHKERPWLLPLKLAAGGFLMLVAIGGSVGATVAAVERGWTGYRMGVVMGFVIAASAIAAWLLWSVYRRPERGLEPRNIGTARRLTIASGAIGGLLGGMLAIAGLASGDKSDGLSMFSSAPLPPLLAAAVLAAIAVVIPISWVWHRSIDEHESAAYRFGALIGINVYFFLSAGWWIAARGGFVPAPDGVAIFLTTVAAWGLGWAWARYR